MMEGLEQLDTVVSFRDGGSGVARELQRAASRAQSSRSERNPLQAFRHLQLVRPVLATALLVRRQTLALAGRLRFEVQHLSWLRGRASRKGTSLSLLRFLIDIHSIDTASTLRSPRSPASSRSIQPALFPRIAASTFTRR